MVLTSRGERKKGAGAREGSTVKKGETLPAYQDYRDMTGKNMEEKAKEKEKKSQKPMPSEIQDRRVGKARLSRIRGGKLTGGGNLRSGWLKTQTREKKV